MISHFETPWLMITGGDVVLPEGDVIPDGTVLINQGIIQEVIDKPPASLLLGDEEVSIIDASGHWVTPGLIDQHLHGAFGIDFNQTSISEIHQLLEKLPQYGITAILPTLISAPKLDMVIGLSQLEEVLQTPTPTESRILGLHLEGPFLNPQFRGAHASEDLLPPSQKNIEGLLSPSVKRFTIAPELDREYEIIHTLIEQGILCSMGHSGADFLTAMEACHAGVSCATHLYNAMLHIEHRHPGIAVASLLNDNLFVELIADGKHLSPPIIQLTLKAKPFEKTILISDCNALTGLSPGASMRFGKQTVTMHPEGALNEEGRLAGSTTLITHCVRNMVQWGLLEFPHAVQMATLHPALHLGVTQLFGQITPGARGDIVLWNKENLDIEAVYLAGQEISLDAKNPKAVSLQERTEFSG